MIAENADFYRRNNESISEIKDRIKEFIRSWWKQYI